MHQHFDFTSVRRAIRAGHLSVERALQASHAASLGHDCTRAYTRLKWPAGAKHSQYEHLPLAGAATSIKPLFDAKGWVTHAGSAVLANAPAALTDSPAVQRLRRAGAALMGQSHMVEFAFSGVGTNPHYAAPASIDGLWGTDLHGRYVSGGSSSGAGVSVASAGAWIGLGSDTGGSIRIPAALNGVVGFKSTARRVPLAGAIPLSHSLDTACAITRSTRDALLVHEVLAQRRVVRSQAPLSAWRLAVPQGWMLQQLDPLVERAFERSLAILRSHGAKIQEIPTLPLEDIAEVNALGGLAAPECYAWHKDLMRGHSDEYDPRVLHRIQQGKLSSAADYIQTQERRRAWITSMEKSMSGWDAFLSPTTAITAPLLSAVAPGQERDAAFFAANALLLRNTSAINLLDGCALSLPCHQPGEMPVGLMIWHAAEHDDAILNIGLKIEEALLGSAFAQGAQRYIPPAWAELL